MRSLSEGGVLLPLPGTNPLLVSYNVKQITKCCQITANASINFLLNYYLFFSGIRVVPSLLAEVLPPFLAVCVLIDNNNNNKFFSRAISLSFFSECFLRHLLSWVSCHYTRSANSSAKLFWGI
jgi:hypothetical protein